MGLEERCEEGRQGTNPRVLFSDDLSSPLLQIYHATCHAEALASTSNIVARLRTGKAYDSRSATPEVQPLTSSEQVGRSTPPSSQLRKSRSKSPQVSTESKVAGMKRKVEHTDSNLPQEANGTPPHKRVALPAVLISK
jgi:pre-mRNA cleavage complex 2 protein Pcf11